MKVGFTGTQLGMSFHQKRDMKNLLPLLSPTEFHHGDCIGADAEAHEMARQLNIPIILHPPLDKRKAAGCVKGATETRPAKPYIQRNHDIVDETEILIATPNGPEELRSGTWATIRYAKKIGRPIHILWPDGYER